MHEISSMLGLNTLYSETFEQLLVLKATLFFDSNIFEQLFAFGATFKQLQNI